MNYSLAGLIDWARREGGDRIVRTTDNLTSDGTSVMTLNNTGAITVFSVRAAGILVDSDDYTVEENLIVFDTALPDGTSVTVVYGQSVYTNIEILEFVVDAAKTVKSELVLGYDVIHVLDSLDADVSDLTGIVYATDKMDQTIEKLIALKAGIKIRTDLANTAAGDAIMVRDGDTTIDTAKTAQGNETVLKRMIEGYAAHLRTAIVNRTVGVRG